MIPQAELPGETEAYRYEVDEDNRITGVGRNWSAYAEDNDWAGNRCLPENVVGLELTEFIEGLEMRELYRALLERARKGAMVGPISFRCDAPEERRFLELRMEPRAHGHVAIESRVIRREPRDAVALLQSSTVRNDQVLRICSMCKKVDVSHNDWIEIEEAMTRLQLFDQEKMPMLSHGLCQTCHDVTKEQWKQHL